MPNTTPYPIIAAADVEVMAQSPLIKAMEAINRTDARIALVVDDKGHLIGSLTDGDIRRALLKGATLESPAKEAMHTKPHVMPAATGRNDLIAAMQAAQVKQMPLIEAGGRLKGIAVYDMLSGFERVPRSNPVVIMAGGKGKRLLPLTQDIPKPMVEIAGKPMLEHIIEQFVKQGFSNFYLAVNHLGHMIEKHFGDGKKFACRIHYIREKESMGTAGALSLIDPKFSEPFLVINGDILTSVDFSDLLDYHIASGSAATVCARGHRTEVPYGVIQMKNGILEAIVEKPVYEDLISAGVYVLNPEILRIIPQGRITDMPVLLQSLVQNQQTVAVFPMREAGAIIGRPEEWMTVDRHDDLERVKRRYDITG